MAVIRWPFLLKAWFLFSTLWFLCFVCVLFFFLLLFICLQKIIYVYTIKHSKDWTSSSRIVLYCITNNIDSHFLWQLLYFHFSLLLFLVFQGKVRNSFLDTLQSSLSHVSSSPLLGPCLLIKICNWIKQVYVSTSCFLCNLCPTPHNSKQKKKKGNVFPFTEKNQLSSLLKWNHMYLFLGKSSKKPEGSL